MRKQGRCIILIGLYGSNVNSHLSFRQCQNMEKIEDCWSRNYLLMIQDTCKCIPFSIRQVDKSYPLEPSLNMQKLHRIRVLAKLSSSNKLLELVEQLFMCLLLYPFFISMVGLVKYSN